MSKNQDPSKNLEKVTIESYKPIIDEFTKTEEKKIEEKVFTDSYKPHIDPVKKEGVRLVIIALIIMSGFILFVFFSCYVAEYCKKSHFYNILMNQKIPIEYKNEIIKEIQKNSIELYNFLKDMIQIVLVNVLLPIITAILGYIFGTKET